MYSVVSDMDGNPATPLHCLQIFIQIVKEDGRQLVIRKIKISAQGLEQRIIFLPVCQAPHLFFVEWPQWCVLARDGH